MTADAPELPPPTAQGTLAKTPLPHLLLYVLERQLTGSLELCAPSGERVSILLLEGFPSKARTSEPVARLGRVMVDQGILTEVQHAESLARFDASSPPRLHGAILLEMGFVDGPRLLEGLRRQVILKLEHLFDWPAETQFAYYDSFDALSDYGADDMVSIDPLPLVWASVRQAPSWEHVHATMTKVGSAAMRIGAGAELDRLALSPDERTFADLIAGRPRRLHEITSVGTLNPSVKQLLIYCLVITRQIELVADGVAASAPPQATTPPSGPPPMPTSAQSAAALARVQLRRGQAKVGSVVEERAPGVRRRDRRASSPTLESVPNASVEAAIAAAMKGQPSPIAPVIQPLPSPASAPVTTVSAAEPPPPRPLAHAAAPPAGPGAPPTTEMTAMRQKILERAAAITAEDYFRMLGVARDATKEEVQAAFFALAKTWHPDRLPAHLADVREPCSTVFSHLSEAHQTLSDPERRRHYDTLMKEGGATPDDQKQITNILEAATNFQKACQWR